MSDAAAHADSQAGQGSVGDPVAPCPATPADSPAIPADSPAPAPGTQPQLKPPGTLIVTVHDDSNSRLDQATVKIDGRIGKQDNTKADGTVTFKGLIDGSYSVTASKKCFTTVTLPSTVNVPGGGTATADVQLAPCNKLTLVPATSNICGAGKTGTLTATPNCPGGAFGWASSDTKVATVTGSAGTATVTAAGTGTVTITATYTISGCSATTATATVKVCVCTPSTRTPPRYYSSAFKAVANLTGAKASIKTRYGKLCCEDLACTDVAMKCTYVNISKGGKWAQAGYRRDRNAGSTTVTNYIYAEMNGNVFKPFFGSGPAEGTSHEFKIELDPATGTWNYLLDGTVYNTVADDFWKANSGESVQYTGEILNKEDDMSGTAVDKCNFTGCQVRTGSGAYADAGLAAANLINNDATEWGNQLVSGSAINIWDIKPNP